MLRKSGRISATSASSSANASSGMRRKRKEQECMLRLERVLGLTSNKPMILSVNGPHDMVAYAAGCIVVLYNHKLDRQVGLLCSSTLKTPGSDGVSSSSGVGGSGPGAASASAGPGGVSGVSHGYGSRGLAASTGSPRAGGGSSNSQWMHNAMGSGTVNPMAGLAPMSMEGPSGGSGGNKQGIKPKPISCLSFSPDGQFLAIGETGHQPRILVWEVASQLLVAELHGHKFGVQALQFSPNSKYIVSVGFQHDGYVHVWNWRTNTQIASNKVTTRVNAIAFSSDGTFFITAGLRHIKFWYLNAPKKVGSSSFVQVLDGRSGILGEMRDCNFVDAVCSPEGRFTYAVSSNGTLCLFTEGRVLEKWVDLHVRGAYSVNLEERCVVCACTDGMIRLFEHGTLEYIGTLPKPPPLGAFPGTIDNAKEESPQDPETALYADVLASQFDASSNSLVCIYSDRSLLVWDMQDHKNAVLSRSHLFHSDCVWGAEMLPEPVKEGEAKAKFPEGTFITYSADGTIKFWDLEDNASVSQPEGKAPEAEETPAPSTPHKDLLMVLYVDDNTKAWIQVPEHQDGIEPGFNLVPLECGIRTARISTDGRYLASGDKGGNLRVHDLATFSQITYQEAHDSEIMAIDFTDSNVDAPLLVATAGRDRLVHVFDAVNDYALLQTLDDHSSSITSIKFTANGSRMMSCGADKSIIFRNCNKSADGMTFQPYHQAPGRATFFDMGMHNNSQTVSVVSGDRRFNVFTLDSGKPIKSFKAEIKGDEAVAGMVDMCSMTHLSLDPTGTIAAACGSDKSIRIYDMLTGTCLGQMICHSELVTSVRFSNNFERIISTSADGCILVWRLNKDLVRRIQHRIDDNITLPTYIQNKTADPPAAASSPQSTVASRVRKTRLRQSTDRLSTHTSEYTNTSRRNSATSLASDDDSRADEHADDWNASHARKPTGPRSEDPSKINFAPVTVSKAAHLSPASPSMGATSTSTPRTRVAAAKTPITRSRHNSASQPATPKSTTTVRTSSHGEPPSTPKSTTTARTSSHGEQPAWNRGGPRDRVATNSPGKATQEVNPRQRTRTSVKSNWLPTSSARPRASSMTTGSDKPAVARAKAADTASESKDAHGDDAKSPKKEATEAEEEDVGDELSDELESHQDAESTAKVEVETLVDEDQPVTTKPTLHRSASDDGSNSVREASSAATNSVTEDDEPTENEEGGSDARDVDVDDEDDESVSDPGSDIDGQSKSRQRTISEISLSLTGGVKSSFQEGESLLDSPSQGGSSAASSRALSMARLPTSTRHSLSAKFLMSHAAMLMMGLVKSRREQDAREAQGELGESALLERDVESNSSTPRPGPHHSRGDSMSELDAGREVPLEERLNTNSLNMVVAKRKLGSIIKSVAQTQREQNGNGQPAPVEDSDAHPKQRMLSSGGRSGDLAEEVERTRKRLIELGYLTTSGGSIPVPAAATETELAEEATKTSASSMDLSGKSQSDEAAGEPEDKILASPALVSSPTGVIPPPSALSASISERLLSRSSSSEVGGLAVMENEEEPVKEGLQDALERISILIANKAVVSGGEAKETGERQEILQRLGWMKETRDGLLSLVGEVQGHLWALEKAASSEQKDQK